MTSRTRTSVFTALLTVVLLTAPAALAEVSQRAIDRAQSFLKTREMGKNILAFVHFGADYKGHAYLYSTAVTDEDDRQLPDKIALVYRFRWEDDGVTDIAFLCNSKGSVYGVRIMKHNGTIQQPFMLADVTIQVLGNAIIEAMGDDLKDAQRAELKRFVDAADSRGLLVAYLRLSQH
jgi:hypothetical protein